MGDYRITYIGDSCVSDVHHIGVEYDGNYYCIIFGKYVNGGFCSIPNWNAGCELSNFTDVFWNTEKLYETLKNKKKAKAIALAIAEFAEMCEHSREI